MDVDILCSSRELFGADRCALRLGEVLHDLGHDATIVVPRSRPERGLAAEAAARSLRYEEAPIAIASSRGVDDPAALRLRRAGARPALTVVNSTAVLGLPRRGRASVVIVREWLAPNSPRHRALAWRHRAHADAVVGISSGVLAQWAACVPGPRRRFLVPDWLEPEILRSAVADHGEHRPRGGILFVGRFNAWKGQDALADAYERAFGGREQRPALTFVGAQPGTEFAAGAEALQRRGVPWGWRVLPFTSDPSEHFASAALTVVPSLRPEPFGLVIVEALALGSRVAAYEGGGPSDLRRHFPDSLALVPRSSEALADALSAWWEAGAPGQGIEERAQTAQTLAAEYSHEAACRRWREILDSGLLPAGGAGRG